MTRDSRSLLGHSLGRDSLSASQRARRVQIGALADPYAEAIHELLRCAIAALKKRLARPVEDSMTSREIVSTTPLDEDIRAALRVLVQAVEISLFGDAPMTSDDFRRCRASFERIVRPATAAAGA
jgi:hypothetical protein